MSDTPILIIDDEPGVLEGLREFLEDEGYDVYLAIEGEEAIETFRSVKPDLVMADLRMPGMSGIDVIGEIRKLNEFTPIIIVTGYGNFKSAVDAIRLNVFDYITKPIDLESLKKTLDRAGASVRKAQEIQKEIGVLREQVALFQAQWKEQFAQFSEVEPLIHTGRLLAGVLHNLNNPLTYIMGQAELLQILHPDIEDIGVIEEQAIRMKNIMATIMKRVTASQMREFEWLQLNDVLREEVFFLESHPYFKAQIVKVWDLDDDLPMFKGILAEFSQIFGNILRNAAESMQGSPVKSISLKTWHDDAWIYVSIKDSGPGIDSHIREKIFQPFFSTKTSEIGMLGGIGMGIGLYHCRDLIEQYGGHITVESLPGKGAKFLVQLPLPQGDIIAPE